MNKFTYGKTPAAIYLAEYLGTLNSPKLNRKVARKLADVNELINQIEQSNNAGIMTSHNVGALASLLLADVRELWLESDEVDFETLTLVNNLVRNMLIGRLKDLARRVQMVRIFEHQQATSDSAPTKPLASVQDCITPALLVERSRRRLTRLNKVNTLY